MEPTTIKSAGSTIGPFVTSISSQQTETTISEIPSGSSDTFSDDSEENTPKLANGSDPVHDNSEFPHLFKNTWMAEISETTDRTSENLGDTCKACLKGNFKRLRMHLSKNPLCWKAYNVDTPLRNHETMSPASPVSRKNGNNEAMDIDKIKWTSPSVVCKGCNRGGIKRLKTHLAFAPFCQNMYTRLDATARKERRQNENDVDNDPNPPSINKNFPSEVEMEDVTNSAFVSSSAAAVKDSNTLHEPFTHIGKFWTLKNDDNEGENCKSCKMKIQNRDTHFAFSQQCQAAYGLLEQDVPTSKPQASPEMQHATSKIEPLKTPDDNIADDSSNITTPKYCKYTPNQLKSPVAHSEPSESPKVGRLSGTGNGSIQNPVLPLNRKSKTCRGCHKKSIKHIKMHFVRSPQCRAAYGLSTNNARRHFSDSQPTAKNKKIVSGPSKEVKMATDFERRESQRSIPKNFGSTCKGCKTKGIPSIGTHLKMSPRCYKAYKPTTSTENPAQAEDVMLKTQQDDEISVTNDIKIKYVKSNFGQGRIQRVTCNVCKKKNIKRIETHLAMSQRCRSLGSAVGQSYISQRTPQKKNLNLANVAKAMSNAKSRQLPPGCVGSTECKYCKKTTKRIRTHLTLSPRCQQAYDLDDLALQARERLNAIKLVWQARRPKSGQVPPGCVGSTECKYCKKPTKRIRTHLTLSPRCQQAYDLHDLALQARERLNAMKSVWLARRPKKHAALGGSKSIRRKVQRRRMLNDAKASNTNQRKKPVLPKREQDVMDSVREEGSEETSKSQVPDIQENDLGLVSEVIEDTHMIRLMDNYMNKKSGTPKSGQVNSAVRSNGYLSDSSDSSRATSPPIRCPKTSHGPLAVASQEPHVVSTPAPTSVSTASAISIELKDVLKVFKDSWDEDDLFMSSMTCALKQIQHNKRQEVKMKIMKLIYEAPRINQETTTPAKH